MNDTSIHSAAWLLNPDTPPIEHGAILIDSGRIVASGTLAELKARYAAPVHEHHDCVILPGFTNAHTHLELTHFPAWREKNGMGYSPRGFVDWIIQLIKVTRNLQTEDFRSSLVEGLRKCVEAGTTAVGDILSRYELHPSYTALPVRGRLFFEVLGHDRERFAARLDKARSCCDSLAGMDIQPGISPHAAYTCGEGNLLAVRDAASAGSVPLAIHIAESSIENDFLFDTSGPFAETFYPFVDWQRYLTPPRRCSATDLFDRHGLLTPATLAIHCVHVTPADARILKERGCSICLCPRSNDRLDVGKAPVGLFRKLGIPLALGTDSLASNDSLSLWDEMRYALDRYGDDLSPADLLRMATLGGAAALGLQHEIGSLTPGKRADFQIIANCGSDASHLLERAIGQGRVVDVCIGGNLGSELPA